MSIKSTHIVTREFALAAIEKRMYQLTDEHLAQALEEVIHNGFYNFQIVSHEEMDENRQKEHFPDPFLDDLDNLPEYNDAF